MLLPHQPLPVPKKFLARKPPSFPFLTDNSRYPSRFLVHHQQQCCKRDEKEKLRDAFSSMIDIEHFPAAPAAPAARLLPLRIFPPGMAALRTLKESGFR